MPELELPNWALIFLSLFGAGILVSLILLGWVLWKVRRVRLPQDADWITAMHMTPFPVVLLLDLLDFSLDIFSVPITWPLLGYLGLGPLRRIAVIEGLIPGTQFIPTLTVSWILARTLSAR